MADGLYDYRDLVRAYLDRQEHHDTSDQVRAYYDRRFNVLADFYGAHLEDEEVGSDGEKQILLWFFRKAAENHPHGNNPFSGLMEAPDEICRLYQRYGDQFSRLRTDLRPGIFEMLCDLFRAIYWEKGGTVTSYELRKLGLDDSELPPAST